MDLLFAVCVPGYYYEGFLAIQRAADLSIISELGGASVQPALTNIGVSLKAFPEPPDDGDPLTPIVREHLSIIILLCFMIMALIICHDVVLEKEKKLKAGVICLVGFFSGFHFESIDIFLALSVPEKHCRERERERGREREREYAKILDLVSESPVTY